ncbi:hypothetical protein T265_08458 [Opisthorchis viverrini]|uniref:Uncharacterized protein n=1 Tax=Opisthorchis viverrini TaxID=6198 RepID=A0A074ZK58_OPIVI|nr:hypothetical protein T265_08458 [Opisthorchis viverrini]KER23735.1 hypothetical protein T265_08458 [Opisthorchis viverrini]
MRPWTRPASLQPTLYHSPTIPSKSREVSDETIAKNVEQISATPTLALKAEHHQMQNSLGLSSLALSGVRVIATPVGIARLNLEGTDANYTTEPTFHPPLSSGERTFTFHSAVPTYPPSDCTSDLLKGVCPDLTTLTDKGISGMVLKLEISEHK